MLKNITISLILLLSTVCCLNASTYQGNYLEESFSEQTELLGAYIFQGDSHGDFRGDYVAVLSDGSQWKVHPDHPQKFQGWNVGDRIHVEVRTSFYWFKREHKFHLYNHNNGEYIKVMLVDYGDQPLVVIDATKPVATDSYIVPIFRTDSNGNIYVIGEREVPCSYKSYVTLSDGSVWTISKEFSKFKYGRKVYVGYNESSVSIDPFLISGIEREVNWVWTN